MKPVIVAFNRWSRTLHNPPQQQGTAKLGFHAGWSARGDLANQQLSAKDAEISRLTTALAEAERKKTP